MEILTPFGANNSERVLPGVNALKPNGMTPIAASLSAASKDFAGKHGTYFFLLGKCGHAAGIGPDATFQLDFIDQSDANSGRDAGSSEDRALEIKPGLYPHNNMNSVDTMDVFKFKADAGTAYQFKVRSANDNAIVLLHAVDSDGIALGDGQSRNRGAVAKIDLKLAKAGVIFVKVSYYDGSNGDYAFALGPGDIDSPPKPPPR